MSINSSQVKTHCETELWINRLLWARPLAVCLALKLGPRFQKWKFDLCRWTEGHENVELSASVKDRPGFHCSKESSFILSVDPPFCWPQNYRIRLIGSSINYLFAVIQVFFVIVSSQHELWSTSVQSSILAKKKKKTLRNDMCWHYCVVVFFSFSKHGSVLEIINEKRALLQPGSKNRRYDVKNFNLELTEFEVISPILL